MTTSSKANWTSDGELVQAVSEKAADQFYFINSWPSKIESDKDHGGWIEILDVSAPTGRAGSDPDDDNGLPDTIIWCIAGDGDGSAAGEEIVITYEMIDRTWSVNGEEVEDAGMSSLLSL
jgi:hypothetical protein